MTGESELLAWAIETARERKESTVIMRPTGIPAVLIADDDACMRRLLRLALEPMGLEITEAKDAMAALTLIHETPPDLAILDINMPGGNGLSACEMLASDSALTHVPVIILTGKSDDSTLFRCHNLGAHYICKGGDAVDRVKTQVRRLLPVGGAAPTPCSEAYVG